MMFLTPETGELRFPGGLSLRAGMEAREIDPHLRSLPGQEAVFCLPQLPVEGGLLAPVCVLEDGRLAAVRLTAAAVTGRHETPGERQRAFLFALLGLKDPCPDTRQSVQVTAPFGSLTLYTDPVTGQAGALVEYGKPAPAAEEAPS